MWRFQFRGERMIGVFAKLHIYVDRKKREFYYAVEIVLTKLKCQQLFRRFDFWINFRFCFKVVDGYLRSDVILNILA